MYAEDVASLNALSHRRGSKIKFSTENYVVWFLALFILLLSLLPLLRLLWVALAPQGFLDLGHVINLLASKKVLRALNNTLIIALAATLLSLLLGGFTAWLVDVSDIRAKSFLVFVFVLPFMIPPQVIAFAWMQALSPSSWLFTWLEQYQLDFLPVGVQPLYSLWGIVLVLGLYNAPLVFLTVRAGLRRLPSDLIEAAKTTGASSFYILRTITLPLMLPAIMAGVALTFVSAVGNFGIQAVLGIPGRVPTLITLVYQQLNSFGTEALPNMAVYSLLIGIITIAGLIITNLISERKNVNLSGVSAKHQVALGKSRIWIELAIWLWLFLIVGLPVFSLFMTSLLSGYGQTISWENIALTNYAQALFHYPLIRQAFSTSLLLTVLTAIILTLISLLLAFFISWRKTGLVRIIQYSVELSYVLPGIIIGVAMILNYLPPLPLLKISLYGSIWIILLAYLAHFMALTLRPTLAGFAQLERSLDEAAQICGASFFRRLKDILLPLVAPSAAAGTILVFMTVLNEIQVSILLITSRTQTIGPSILFLDEGGASTLAAAVGCLLILIVLLLMLLTNLFAKRLPAGVIPWKA